MQKLPTSVNVTVFVLFFGISMLDAVATHNWWRAAFWLGIGLLFLGANRFARRE